MLTFYILYLLLVWKSETLEKKFYIHFNQIESYETRFGKIDIPEEEQQENIEEQLFAVKEDRRHEKYYMIDREYEDMPRLLLEG